MTRGRIPASRTTLTKQQRVALDALALAARDRKAAKAA